MAVQTLNLASITSTDATFRAWGQGISNGIVAAGLVRTADTGQINWATVLKPGTTLTKAGYEIFRFDDALQATRPVFVRLDYGLGLGSNNPEMWIGVGTATDGAGTLTAHASWPNSFISTANSMQMFYNASVSWGTSLPAPLYVDSDGGSSLMIAGWLSPPGSANPSYGGTITLVERSRNMDGTPNGDGILIWVYANVAPGSQARYITYLGAPYLSSQFGGSAGQPGVITVPAVYATLGVPAIAFFGGVQYFTPVFTGALPLGGPSKHLVTIGPSDLPVLATVPLSHYGVSKTWMASGLNIGIGLGQPVFRIS